MTKKPSGQTIQVYSKKSQKKKEKRKKVENGNKG